MMRIVFNQLARFLFLVVPLITWPVFATCVTACPFCDAVSATFTQEMEIADMAVMAKLVKRPDEGADLGETIPKATFEIYHILKGEKISKIGQKVEAIYLGEAKVGTKFLLYGAATPTEEWTPTQMSDSAEAYILDLVTFPKDPKDVGERMVRMQKYLADTDKAVHLDAMSEFAAVDVRDLLKVKDKLNIEQIRKTVADPKTDASLMALNYSLLGICGNSSDVPLLESRLMKGDDLQMKRLDALVGSYLMLTKEAGLDLIEKKILMPSLEKDDFPRFNATLMALRYHGDDGVFISKEKIAPIMVKILDYPKRADLVILDLSRWKNWESADRIMKLYRDTSDEDNPWIREPAINFMNNYLKANPESEKVKGYLAEMQRIDPEAYKRAKLFFSPLPKSLKDKPKDAKAGKKIDLNEKSATDGAEQGASNKSENITTK